MVSNGFFLIASVASLSLTLQGSAFGALTNEEQACIAAMNNALRQVSKQQGKENEACVKNASKGREADPQGCLTADPKGKVGKKKATTLADETRKCTMGAPIGYTSGADVNTAAIDQSVNLVAEVYGPNLTGVIATTSPEGPCQAAIMKRVAKIVDIELNEFLKCKKTALKNGAMTAAEFAGCLGQDPKGKIGKTIQKLGDDIAKKCVGVKTNAALPGSCAGLTGNTLRDCLDHLAECRVCLMVTAADDLAGEIDCDLFDDTVDNDSCLPAPPLGAGTCTLDAGSQVILHSALPLPPLPATGAVDVTCGVVDGGTGKATCDCTVQPPGFDPLLTAGLFWACVKPASTPCPSGEIDCNGGNQLGLALQGYRNIGSCTSNADCAAACTALCDPAAVFTAQCEGFCAHGAEMACTTDAQCAMAGQGSCNGPDGVGLGNICDCTCIDDATGGPSDPGDIRCQLGFNLTVEPNPGNGIACDGIDVSQNFGDTCAPVTTQSVTSILNNGNDGGTALPPGGFSDAGVNLDCTASETSGAEVVGATIFYASTVGDLNVGLKAVCQ